MASEQPKVPVPAPGGAVVPNPQGIHDAGSVGTGEVGVSENANSKGGVSSGEGHKSASDEERITFHPNMMINEPVPKRSKRSSASGGGSQSPNGGGSGNNSDNSGMFSLGNTSFGFNFDSEEGMINSSAPNSEADNKVGESASDSDGGSGNGNATKKSGGPSGRVAADVNVNGGLPQQLDPVSSAAGSSMTSSSVTVSGHQSQDGGAGAAVGVLGAGPNPAMPTSVTVGHRHPSVSSVTNTGIPSSGSSALSQQQSSASSSIFDRASTHEDRAATAVAHLHSIANTACSSHVQAEAEAPKAPLESSPSQPLPHPDASHAVSHGPGRNGTDAQQRNEAAGNEAFNEDDSGGYNSDDEDGRQGGGGGDTTGSSTNKSGPQAPGAANVHPSPSPQDAVSFGSKTAGGVKRPASEAFAASPVDADGDGGDLDGLDDDDAGLHGSAPSKGGKKGKKLDDSKREERNAREKERSFRISRQINDLRNLLSSGGVIVPKGTKSSVLTEAANYIRMLQQHQYRSEIDRHHLVQQMQLIGSGALGPVAANAIRHVAAQNGVWSLGNFGGVPPRSAMAQTETAAPPPAAAETKADGQQATPFVNKIEEHEYRYVFNSCAVGMAIASMGGAFIDCNRLFCELSQFTKQEVCSMTIFNMTSRADLQHAFDLISRMISPPGEGEPQDPKQSPSCVLRGQMKNREDLGLCVALIKGDDGIAKCFCVTLIRNPTSPYDASRPTPASADMVVPQPPVQPAATLAPQPVAQPMQTKDPSNLSAPAYTAG